MRRTLLLLVLAAGARGEDLDTLVARLGAEPPSQRVEAARALGAHGAAAVPALVDALFDETYEVSEAAMDALRRIGPAARGAAPALEEWRAAGGYTLPGMQRALDAIGRDETPPGPALLLWLRRKGKLPGSATSLDTIPEMTLSALLVALRQEDAAVCGQAALVLGRFLSCEEVLPALVAALDHASPYVRKHAMLALARGGTKAAPPLAAALGHDDVRRRRLAAEGLRRIGRSAATALPALIAATRDEDYHVRLDVIRTLRELRAPAAVPALVDVLDGPDVALHGAVMAALCGVGEAAAPATEALIRQLASPGMRGGACNALAAIGPAAAPAVPGLVQAAYDEDRHVMGVALAALQRIGPVAKAAAPFLAELAEAYPDARVQVQPILAAWGAGEPLPPAPEPDDLAALVANLAAEDPVRAGRAAFALGRLATDDAEALAALRRALGHEIPYVRRHASLALLRIGPASVPVLCDAASEGGVVERRLAVGALAELTRFPGKVPIAVLVAALDDEDTFVRTHAASAVGRIGRDASEAIPHLLELLELKDGEIAPAAAWAIGRMGADAGAAVPALVPYLLDEPPNSRLNFMLLSALGEIGPAAERAIPAIRAVAVRDTNLAGNAVDTLLRLGPAGHVAVVEFIRDHPGTTRETAIERLQMKSLSPPGLRAALDAAVQDDDPRVRQRALQWLQTLPAEGETSVEAIVAGLRKSQIDGLQYSYAPLALARTATAERLLELAGDPDMPVRWGALSALARTDPDVVTKEQRARGFEIVRRALGEEHFLMRSAAARALAVVPPPEVTLGTLAAMREVAPRDRALVAAALADAADVAMLVDALSRADPDVRRAAAATLAAKGEAAAPAVPALVRALERDPEMAVPVLLALAGIGEAAVPALVDLYPGLPKQRVPIERAVRKAGDAALPHAEELLQDADPLRRRAAARLLGVLGEAGFGGLLRAARDRDFHVRDEALSVLGRFPDRAAAVGPVLVRNIAHEAARRALRQMGPAAFPFLEQAAASPDAAVRAGACEVLGFHGKQALPLLRRGVRDPDEPVRAAAAGALGQLGREAQPAVPELGAALRDGAPSVRSAAALALARLGDLAVVTVPELVRLFQGGDARDRHAAGRALVSLGGASSPYLVRFLVSKDAALRRASSDALTRIGAAAVPSLADAMAKGDYLLLTGAGEALSRMGRPAVEALVGLLSHDDADVRRHAAWRLGQMKRAARGAIPALIAALDDDGAFVSSQAAWSLGQIGPLAAAALPRLEEMRKAGKHVKVVKDAIARIKGE